MQLLKSASLPVYLDVDLILPYHDAVEPVRSILEQDLGLPAHAAAILSLAFPFFSLLYCVAALFFGTFGYHGRVRCGNVQYQLWSTMCATSGCTEADPGSYHVQQVHKDANQLSMFRLFTGGRWLVLCRRLYTAALLLSWPQRQLSITCMLMEGLSHRYQTPMRTYPSCSSHVYAPIVCDEMRKSLTVAYFARCTCLTADHYLKEERHRTRRCDEFRCALH
jgi:hypothetical protein